MPRKNEQEIIDFHAAVKAGTLVIDHNTGYLEACEKVPSLKKKCLGHKSDSAWRGLFVTWLSRYKGKVLASDALKIVKPQSASKPNPSVPSSNGVPFEEAVTATNPEKLPPAYKPPKDKHPNHQIPAPAPSPTTSPTTSPKTGSPYTDGPAENVTYCFEDSFWERTPATTESKPKTRSTAKTASPKTASSTTASSTTASSTTASPKTAPSKDTSSKETVTMSNETPMTPEERADDINKKLLIFPSLIDLREADSHKYNIERYQWAWAATNGTLHMTYAIKGGEKASIQPGGRTIHVTMRRSKVAGMILDDAEKMDKFAMTLTNGRVLKEWRQMKKAFNTVMSEKKFAQTVSY
jgi:hypothetical protein